MGVRFLSISTIIRDELKLDKVVWSYHVGCDYGDMCGESYVVAYIDGGIEENSSITSVLKGGGG